MQQEAILQTAYLDIVFNNRNKLYGGYELRTNYQKRMSIAIATVVAACVALGTYGILQKDATPQIADRSVPYGTIDLKKIDPPIVYTPKTQLPPAAAAPAKTVKLTPPIVVPDKTVKPEDLLPPKKDMDNAVAGNTTNTTGTTGTIPSAKDGTDTKPHIVTPPADKPYVFVEQMPEFAGDMAAYLSNHINYPAAARDNDVEGKVIVRFVVNEDGSVSDAQVLRGIGSGCDAEAVRVVNAMPRWKPGKQNGKAVKVYYTLPIRFILG